MKRCFLLLTIAAALTVAGQLQALEPWADPALPVTNALVLWLDASRENNARSSNGVAWVAEGGPLNLWHDASGHGRHLAQLLPTARPRLLRTSEGVTAHFDGADDFLFSSAFNQEFTNLTLFLRANPRSNAGMFRALLSAARSSANDYTSGLNFDLGPQPSPQLNFLSIEGCGSGGAQNLATASAPFGEAHLFILQSVPGRDGVRLWVDGAAQRSRHRDCPTLSFQHLALGARLYSNTAEPPHAQGFFDGDVSEVLIFDRPLSEEERTQVERYLTTKHRPVLTPGRRYAAPPPFPISLRYRCSFPGSPCANSR